MTKKLTVITLTTLLFVGSLPFSNYSHAETNDHNLENIKEQRENIKEDISEADKQVANLMFEIEDLNKEIERVNLSLNEKQDRMEKTKLNITNTIEEIRRTQDEIKDLETDIEKRQEILKDRISSYQKTGGSLSFLEVIFGAQSFADLISRVSMVNKITEADATLLENIEADIHKVEEKKKLTLKKLDELNTMKVEQEEALAQLKEEKLQNEQRRVSLEKKQQELIALIEGLQNENKSLASLETEVKQNIAAAAKKAKQSEQATERKNQAKASPEEAKESKADTEEEAVTKVKEPEKETQDNDDKKTFNVTATAYTVESAGGSGVTYTGINLRKNPNTKVIAVDPSFIPLGSVVYVEGYGYAIAGDIGGAINGGKIDVYVPTQQAAIEWGVRTVEVTIQ